MVLGLEAGGTISVVEFDRPGALTELLGQLQRRTGIAERA